MKLFKKNLKPWFKPFKKKPEAGKKQTLLKLHTLSHNRLLQYAEQIGIGVCSQPNSYATELAMKMMDAAYLFNQATTDWQATPVKERPFELYNNVRNTRGELCEWLNRIAYHYMQTEKDYIKALSNVGFEITHSVAPPLGIVPIRIKKEKQL